MRLQHIESRIEQQLTLMDIISKTYDNVTKVGPSNVTVHRIQARLTALSDNWDKFSLNHDAITVACAEISASDKPRLAEHSYFTDNLFTMTHECYLETVEKLNTLLDSLQTTMTRSSSTHSVSESASIPMMFHHARLPRINIPKFDGSPNDWISFKDLFASLVVSNPTLTSVEKLQYLKTSLLGSAAQLIKNTSLTADNFQKAWEALISFYENRRLLVNAALHSLLSLKRMTKESANEMEQLYTQIMQVYRTLETLQRPVATWDDFLVFIAVQRLDAESVKAWEHHLGSSKEPPSWIQFSDFLITRLLSLQAFEKSRIGKSSTQAHKHSAKAYYQGKSADDNSRNSTKTCVLCSLSHYIASCPQYTGKNVQQRLALITKYKLCYNCLGGHKASACRTGKRCQKCGKKHHTTIHRANTSPSNSPEISTKAKDTASKPQDVQVNHSAVTHKTFSILLATAQVKVISAHGETAKVRALIDQGSEISLVSERLVQRLKLSRNHSTLSLVGIGAQKANQTKGVASFKIAPHYDSSIDLTVSAHILPRLTSSIPSLKTDSTSWAHLKGITLADPDFCTPQSIDLILGADSYNQIIEDGLIRESADQPIAQFTKLGWIISGPTGASNTSITANGYHVSVDQELYDLLHRFWELDSVPSSAPRLSPEEQQCESHFATTHCRDITGRYMVRLPFKHSTEKLGESKTKAHRIMTHLLTKLERNTRLAQSYKQFMTEYDQLHHMQRVANSQPEPPHAYYLPHNGVWRENSLTTKLRVVFNGSSRTTSGYSLNDLLHTGEKLQKELINVLFWFRLFRYVFTADVEKMYRQIQVHPEDRDYQRIIWIDDSNHLVTYCLTTVTYGLACAPYLALRTFEQLVQDEGTKFPLAVSTLDKGRYVDDVFGGADSIEEASQIVEQLHRLCMAGGFPLQKWTSNHQDVVASISPEKQINATSLPIEETFQVNALGLIWQPSTDTFHFTWNLTTTDVITKRSILSIVAKLFDPLGFLSPVIIQAKVLIQELWTINLGWDDPVPSHISQKWTHYLTQFQDLPNFSIPRWIGFKSDAKMEIHGFCDASQKAIAAAVYIRTVNSDGHVNTTLLSSKTKVAPLKRQTIPRLELAGAVLLTKLVSCILAVYEISEVPIYLWTDSAITHTWITNHPSRWKEFVHNRVCYIQETLPHALWNFVPGKDNPADLATRGLTPNQLLDDLVWWTGPPWLSDHSSTWPKEPQKPHQSVHLEEKAVQVSTISTNMSTTLWDLIHRYSNLTRLIRITAICRRVISRLRGTHTSVRTHPLTPEELESSMLYWVKAVQQLTFHLEIKALSNGNPLPKANPLLRLTPFIDSAGLIRVGGRLHSAALSNNAKHPLILPKNSTLTTLLIADAHTRTLHGGTQVTLTFIRNNYWIVGGRAPVRSFILKCIRCARFRQTRAQQLMGQLPIERVTPSRPFLHSGIDYAGPLLIKTWRGRNARTYKAYIALFVCLSTSAIHLELVTDYTADAFIAAYKRFSARRGICATLTSDCGSNLKGADEELKRLLSSASQEFGRLAATLANDGTQWKFIPPAAPHFGGKWEAGVRSVKNHLKRVIGDTILTYEEMSTFLTQVEAVLNSRPLCPLSDDPNDLAALTPGHFLIGSALALIPEPALEQIKVSHLSRWQLMSQMTQSFWSRWSSEYLQRHLAIYKWNRAAPSLKEGALVLVVDERYPPSKWPLGRVVKTHPGKDGHTRVVTVRTSVSTLKRPVVKLCPLPISTEAL